LQRGQGGFLGDLFRSLSSSLFQRAKVSQIPFWVSILRTTPFARD
jgi:hypothetical protein